MSLAKYRLMFISVLAVAVGAASGLVAEALLRAINFISNVVYYGKVSSEALAPSSAPFHWYFVLLPAIGGLLVGLIAHYFCKEIAGDGIPAAISTVLSNRSLVNPRVSVFKPLSAAITVGSGGPFGAEGPILQTGGALGSLISRFFSVSTSERRTLLACGAAAGLAAVFKTPIAGALLAIELLVTEFRPRSFIPIALSSIMGTLVAFAFRGASAVFPVAGSFHIHPLELPFFALLGVLCALLAYVVQRTLFACEEFFEHWHKVWFPLVPTFGGLFVGLLALWHPEVLGTGYAVIAELLGKPHPLHALLGIGFAKLLAFSVALGSGASGGTFAPALMIGGSLGAAYGSLVHSLVPHSSTIGLYGMVATAALFGSLYRATFSAALFMLEVTGRFDALLPVLLVAMIAALIMHHLSEHSINTQGLAAEGVLVPQAYSVDPLWLYRVKDVMHTLPEEMQYPVGDNAPGYTPPPDFHPDDILHDVVGKMLSHDYEELYWVVDSDDVVRGWITPIDVLRAKEWEYEQEKVEPGLIRSLVGGEAV